jgi:hypothetical protein
MKRSAKWWIGLGALVGLGLLWACSVLPTTHERREEVALHDGGMIVMKWRVRVDPGPFGLEDGVGPARLTLSHPATGRQVVWEDSGKSGSRLMPLLLALDDQRLFLVGILNSGPDYDGFGCPMPPYVALRYDGGTWRRMPLNELPSRFSNSNLLGYAGRDLIRSRRGISPPRKLRPGTTALVSTVLTVATRGLTAASGIRCRWVAGEVLWSGFTATGSTMNGRAPATGSTRLRMRP